MGRKRARVRRATLAASKIQIGVCGRLAVASRTTKHQRTPGFYELPLTKSGAEIATRSPESKMAFGRRQLPHQSLYWRYSHVPSRSTTFILSSRLFLALQELPITHLPASGPGFLVAIPQFPLHDPCDPRSALDKIKNPAKSKISDPSPRLNYPRVLDNLTPLFSCPAQPSRTQPAASTWNFVSNHSQPPGQHYGGGISYSGNSVPSATNPTGWRREPSGKRKENVRKVKNLKHHMYPCLAPTTRVAYYSPRGGSGGLALACCKRTDRINPNHPNQDK
jgi:hypothetical protein